MVLMYGVGPVSGGEAPTRPASCEQPLDEEARALGAVGADDRVQRVQPVAGLLRVDVGDGVAVGLHVLSSSFRPGPRYMSMPPLTAHTCPVM